MAEATVNNGSKRTATGIAIPALALVCALAIWFIPSSAGTDARHALAIGLLVLSLWVAHFFPPAVTGLIGCYLFWTVVGVPFGTAFGGFAQASAWFVFAAGLFGLTATKTGLARRLATMFLGRASLSYSRLILGFILMSVLLNFLVPSGIARVIILAGIGLGVVKSRGWERGTFSARGLFVTLTISCALFDKLMITGGSTIVAQGIMEKVGRTRVYWSQWLFAQLPALLMSVFVCWVIALWLFPGESRLDPLPGQPVQDTPLTGKWSAAEKRCAVLLTVALCLWLTDFLHHVHPAMVALGVALATVLPRIGVLDADELKRIDFLPFVFTASALSLGDGLMKTGALDLVTNAFAFLWRPWAHSFLLSAIVLYWTSFAYHLLVPSDPTTLATSMPTVMNFALVHKWNPAATGLIWTFALTGKLFVYQSGVTIAGFSFGYFNTRDFFKAGMCLTIAEFLVLLIQVVWYWPLIGLIS